MLRWTIGQFKDDGTIDMFVAHLRNPSSETIRAVEYSDAPRLVPGLIDLFDHSDDLMRRFAVAHFIRHTDPRAVEPLIEKLRDKNTSVRNEAAKALGVQSDRRAIPNLLARIEDDQEDTRTRRSAAEALGRIGGPGVFASLVTIGLKENEFTGDRPGVNLDVPSGSSGARYGAIQGLGHLRDRRGSEMLRSLMGDVDESASIRVAAAKSLGQIEGKDALPGITKLMTDPSEQPALRYGMAVHLVAISGGAIADVDVVAALTFWDRGSYISNQLSVLEAISALEAVASRGVTGQVRSAAKQALVETTRRRGELWPSGTWPNQK
jgi:HEAT repeat protein